MLQWYFSVLCDYYDDTLENKTKQKNIKNAWGAKNVNIEKYLFKWSLKD